MESYSERKESEFFNQSECEILEILSNNISLIALYPNKIVLPKQRVHNKCSLNPIC